MKKTTAYTRIFSLVIALVMLICSVPINTVSSEDSDIYIIHKGEAVSEIVLSFDEKETIYLSDSNSESYQWQIFNADSSDWVDIYGQTASSCEISYNLVEKFLQSDNTTDIRCEVTNGTNVTESHSVKVTIIEEALPIEQVEPIKPAEPIAPIKKESPAVLEDVNTAAADSEFITYTVTIKYLYNNESPDMVGSVANDYIATIAKGTGLDAEVSSPVRTGYEAYIATESDWDSTANCWFNGVDENTLTKGESLKLNIESISENHIYYVVYLPQPAEYHISTYYQNKYDDFYSFGNSIIKEAPVGSVISVSTDLGNQLDGFIMLDYDDTTVAADGSTVLEIYYDREYHLINFELDGGHGVEPVYARYETDFRIAAPSKAGYTFDHWEVANDSLTEKQREKAEEIASNLKAGLAVPIPDFDITFKAKWVAADATYNVIYWKENANTNENSNDSDYSYWGTVTMNATSGDYVTFDPNADEFNIENLEFSSDVVQEEVPSNEIGDRFTVEYSKIDTRYEYDYFVFDEEKSEISATVMGDNSTVINVYYKRRTYDLKFYYARVQSGDLVPYKNMRPNSRGILSDGDYIVWYHISNNQSDRVLTTEQNNENKLVLSKNQNDKDAYTLNFQHVSGDTYYVTDERGYYLEIGAGSSNFTSGEKTVEITWVENPGCWRIGQNGQWLNQHGGRHVTHAGGYGVSDDPGNNLSISKKLDTPDYSEIGKYQLASATTNTTPQSMTWGYSVSSLPEISDSRYTYGYDIIDGYKYHYLTVNNVKYNQIITDLWPTGVVPTSGSYSTPEWAPVDGCKYRTIKGDNATLKVYTTLSAEIINEPDDPDATRFVAWWANETLNDQYFHIYYSAIPNEETNTELHEGREYVKQPLITYKMAYNTWTQITPYEYYGVKLEKSYIANEKPGSVTNATQNSTFYYTRNPHIVSFYNVGNNIKDAHLVYGQRISAAEPITKEVMESNHYPASYEKGAYSFVGWSYSPSAYVPVEWDSGKTMDDADLSVYAYWEKVTHNVKFYETYNDMKNSAAIPDGENANNDVDVPHGEPVNYPSTISREGYDFVGWFYIDEETNEKVAFLPNNMPVNKDLKIYAEWIADKMIRYTIHYIGADAQKDANGEYLLSNGKYVLDMSTSRQIADDTTGQLQDGRTKTFSAKALPELWADYNKGYFPELASHAIMFAEDTNITDPTVTITKVNMDGSPYTEGNTDYTYTVDYTFYYIHLANVKYTVKYINAATGDNKFKNENGGIETVEEVKKLTEEAVTTERFKMIDMYVPDEYQKRIVLTAYPDKNVIKFYYTENESPMFLVEHLTENLDGTWTIQSREFSTGNVGDIVSRQTNEYKGHQFDANAVWVNTQGKPLEENQEGDNWVTEYTEQDGKYHASGTLESGKILVLRFYYTLTVHDYKIEHKILGTDEWLFGTEEASTQKGQGKYGERYIGTAMERAGYYVDGSKTDASRLTQSKIITNDSELNVITFYYVSEPVEINYRIVVNGVVGTNIDGCYVTPSLNSANAHAGSVSGSVPHIADTYYFVGWFTDEACTDSVPDNWVDDSGKITPMAVDGIIKEATYYAKAEPRKLTITKKGDVQDNETFLFNVKNTSKNIDMVVAVTGKGSATIEYIPSGEYTVTELDDWSWKYESTAAKNIQVLATDSAVTVEFTNTRNDNKLLGDETNINNKF